MNSIFRSLSFYAFLFAILSLGSCERFKPDHYLAFVNNSDIDVYCQWSPHYPDTLTIDYHILDGTPSNKVKAHETLYDIKQTSWNWNGYFKMCKSDTILVFVIDADKLDSVGFDLSTWITLYDSIGYKDLYDKYVVRHYKYDCYRDLDQINWTIVFP